MIDQRYEVEVKYRLSNVQAVLARLAELDVHLGDPVIQEDRYFSHPCRDFEQTDEALRIRSVGDRQWMTYKGPKIDTITKTRREIETQIGTGRQARDQMVQIVHALGFTTVATVRKQRRCGLFSRGSQSIEIALDRVENVGDFVELELVSTENSLDHDRQCVLDAAGELGLTDTIRTSYLQMLLDSRR